MIDKDNPRVQALNARMKHPTTWFTSASEAMSYELKRLPSCATLKKEPNLFDEILWTYGAPQTLKLNVDSETVNLEAYEVLANCLASKSCPVKTIQFLCDLYADKLDYVKVALEKAVTVKTVEFARYDSHEILRLSPGVFREDGPNTLCVIETCGSPFSVEHAAQLLSAHPQLDTLEIRARVLADLGAEGTIEEEAVHMEALCEAILKHPKLRRLRLPCLQAKLELVAWVIDAVAQSPRLIELDLSGHAFDSPAMQKSLSKLFAPKRQPALESLTLRGSVLPRAMSKGLADAVARGTLLSLDLSGGYEPACEPHIR